MPHTSTVIIISYYHLPPSRAQEMVRGGCAMIKHFVNVLCAPLTPCSQGYSNDGDCVCGGGGYSSTIQAGVVGEDSGKVTGPGGGGGRVIMTVMMGKCTSQYLPRWKPVTPTLQMSKLRSSKVD